MARKGGRVHPVAVHVEPGRRATRPSLGMASQHASARVIVIEGPGCSTDLLCLSGVAGVAARVFTGHTLSERDRLRPLILLESHVAGVWLTAKHRSHPSYGIREPCSVGDPSDNPARQKMLVDEFNAPALWANIG